MVTSHEAGRMSIHRACTMPLAVAGCTWVHAGANPMCTHARLMMTHHSYTHQALVPGLQRATSATTSVPPGVDWQRRRSGADAACVFPWR